MASVSTNHCSSRGMGKSTSNLREITLGDKEMIDAKLLEEAIADAKAVRLFAMGWSEGQFFGHMGKNWEDGSIYRASCNCRICHQSMSLESSASHAQICKEKV